MCVCVWHACGCMVAWLALLDLLSGIFAALGSRI